MQKSSQHVVVRESFRKVNFKPEKVDVWIENSREEGSSIQQGTKKELENPCSSSSCGNTTHTHTHTHAHAHARTHAHTHTHTPSSFPRLQCICRQRQSSQ